MGREKLKAEIRTIQEKYTDQNPRLTVNATRSLDELTVIFKRDNGERINLTCNIPEDYPHSRPLWSSADDEESDICQAVLEDLGSEELIEDNNLNKMVDYLVQQLCEAFEESLPENVALVESTSSSQPMQIDDEEEDDVDGLLEEVAPAEAEDADIAQDKLQKLEMLRRKQRPTAKSSAGATDRLMKDIKAIYRSDSYKSGHYTVEMVEDNVYEWHVALLKVDPDSELAKDMTKYKVSKIELSITFAPNYPFRPPFIRVISPVIQKGYVLSGGAICLELLTEEGWSSAYSMESVIMQIGASLVKGAGRILPNRKPEDVYTLTKAKNAYRNLVHIHKTTGWYTPPKADG